MTLSRRWFLKGFTLTAFTFGSTLGGLNSAAGQNPKHSTPVLDSKPQRKVKRELLSYYNRSAFDPCVGSTFRVNTGLNKKIDLKLVQISDYHADPNTRISLLKGRETETFSLHFSAKERLPEFTSVYRIEHDALGAFDLFLVYRYQQADVHFYEAVFNRVI